MLPEVNAVEIDIGDEGGGLEAEKDALPFPGGRNLERARIPGGTAIVAVGVFGSAALPFCPSRLFQVCGIWTSVQEAKGAVSDASARVNFQPSARVRDSRDMAVVASNTESEQVRARSGFDILELFSSPARRRTTLQKRDCVNFRLHQIATRCRAPFAHRSSPRWAGFTLIELFVVISFPVFGAFQERGRTTACANNLRHRYRAARLRGKARRDVAIAGATIPAPGRPTRRWVSRVGPSSLSPALGARARSTSARAAARCSRRTRNIPTTWEATRPK